MKNLVCIFGLIITLTQSAFAGGNWCHISSEDQGVSHPNFSLSVDYQVNFNGGTLEAKSAWINLNDSRYNGRIFARVINHYFHGENLASSFIELKYLASENKYTGQIEEDIDLGGVDSNTILKVWQTLEVRYGSVDGPSETKNLNLSKGHVNQRCFVQ